MGLEGTEVRFLVIRHAQSDVCQPRCLRRHIHPGSPTYIPRSTNIYMSVPRIYFYVQGQTSSEGLVWHILAGLFGGDPALPCRVICATGRSQRYSLSSAWHGSMEEGEVHVRGVLLTYPMTTGVHGYRSQQTRRGRATPVGVKGQDPAPPVTQACVTSVPAQCVAQCQTVRQYGERLYKAPHPLLREGSLTFTLERALDAPQHPQHLLPPQDIESVRTYSSRSTIVALITWL